MINALMVSRKAEGGGNGVLNPSQRPARCEPHNAPCTHQTICGTRSLEGRSRLRDTPDIHSEFLRIGYPEEGMAVVRCPIGKDADCTTTHSPNDFRSCSPCPSRRRVDSVTWASWIEDITSVMPEAWTLEQVRGDCEGGE